MDNTLTRNIASLFLFVTLIILIQLNNYLFILIWIAIAIFLFVIFDKSMKLFVITNALFGIGFFVYLYVSSYWIIQIQLEELRLFFNRASLVFILIPLFIFSFTFKLPSITYWKKPKWNEFIYFPFIWSGFHRISVKAFLLIALVVNIVIFMPFIIRNTPSFFEEIWLLAIIFSITNAVFEELIWRGSLLSRFSEQLGEKWAVVITSLGFGLQHYSLGFPWGMCIAFVIGGIFYGAITVRSRSIVPAIIWHIALNIFMAFSGLILK